MEPILSICIPTYNRLELLISTIDSIYSGVTERQFPLFEVVVSDNSKDCNCQSIKEKYSCYPNFHYYKTECEGFLNSYHALSYGKGKYLKLHNNTALFKEKALLHIIELLSSNLRGRPLVFFTDGYRLRGEVQYYSSFEEFMYGASYFTSWSTGFGMWRDDFEQITEIQLNDLFPQTSLLVTQTKKTNYIVDDYNLFKTQNVPQKGGYDLFKAFSVDYLNLIKELRDKHEISERCYNYIKESLLYKFLSVRYFKTVIAKRDNFDHIDIKGSLLVNYTKTDYYKLKIASLWAPLRFVSRELYKKYFTQIR